MWFSYMNKPLMQEILKKEIYKGLVEVPYAKWQ